MSKEIPAAFEFDHQDCLDVDPFEGDFGDPSDRRFSDRIVIARKPGRCHLCGEQIIPGHPTRSLAGKFDGAIERYRWCHRCCQAMAMSWEDGGDAWEDRFRLRRRNIELPTNEPSNHHRSGSARKKGNEA